MKTNVRIPDEFEEGLGYLVHHLLFSFRQHIVQECARIGCPVTPEELAVLLLLRQKDGIRQTDLAASLAKDKAVISRTLNSLDRKGYVRRRHDALDRRIVRGYLTASGQRAGSKLKPVIKGLQQQALRNINQRDYDITRNVLRRMIDNLCR